MFTNEGFNYLWLCVHFFFHRNGIVWKYQHSGSVNEKREKGNKILTPASKLESNGKMMGAKYWKVQLLTIALGESENGTWIIFFSVFFPSETFSRHSRFFKPNHNKLASIEALLVRNRPDCRAKSIAKNNSIYLKTNPFRCWQIASVIRDRCLFVWKPALDYFPRAGKIFPLGWRSFEI